MVCAAHEKHVVFEKTKQRKVCDNRENEGGFPLAFGGRRLYDDLAAEVVLIGSYEKKKREPGYEPTIKDIAHDGYESVLYVKSPPGERQEKIDNQKKRQEIEQENMR
jgi:hypothetical protein